jgi:gas vesicle protein
MKKNKINENKSSLGIAAALVGAAATGFYLYGPKGHEHRKQIKAWTLKAKAEVLEQFEKKKEITQEQYDEIVDRVTSKYGKLKTVGNEESEKLNKELKRHWTKIKKSAQEDTKK